MHSDLTSIVGSSEQIEELRRLIKVLGSSSVSVLITGESGVGKELVARELHAGGARKAGPFIAVNCSAINPGILESELFGHARGAFTGAVRSHAGYFEQADGGTLFLDEIGDMPLDVQAKLLRVLSDLEVRRMGEAVTRKVDIRIVCATNADIESKVEEGSFRKDLFFRVNVVRIRVPPLRRRAEDIPELTKHILRKRGLAPLRFSAHARSLLMRYSWPGNVRELENEMERLSTLFAGEDVIEPEMLSERIRLGDGWSGGIDVKLLYDAPLAEAVGELEQDILRKTLAMTNWNKSRTARKLGLSRQGLLKKIKRYGLRPDPFLVGKG